MPTLMLISTISSNFGKRTGKLNFPYNRKNIFNLLFAQAQIYSQMMRGAPGIEMVSFNVSMIFKKNEVYTFYVACCVCCAWIS